MTSSRPEPGKPALPTVTIEVERRDGTVVLMVSGDIDLTTASKLADAITDALQQGPELLVVDLSEVDFLASAGMKVLLSAYEQAGVATRVRVVASGTTTFRPMDLTGITDRIAVYPTREEALAAS